MSPHTDAGALLKLADRIKRSTVFFRSGDPPRPSVDLTDAEKQLLIDALLRQAASQGREGGEQSEVRSEVVTTINARLTDLAEANALYGKDQRLGAPDKIARNEREISWLKDLRSMIAIGVAQASGGCGAIAAERQRQISKEGWTLEHDNMHKSGEMAQAAAAYALSAAPPRISDLSLIHRLWPWDWSWFKPYSQRDDLVRAGALIAAEIDRLDRASPVPSASRGTEA